MFPPQVPENHMTLDSGFQIPGEHLQAGKEGAEGIDGGCGSLVQKAVLDWAILTFRRVAFQAE